jgi:hypothetical protein
MKYLLIDTNIFIDMIIDRKKNVSEKLVESFVKLLDFDEIKLLIPSIVVHETNKHIEEQLSEVGKKIECAIKAIDEIYGINGYKVQGLEVKQYKKNSKKELNTLLESYNNSKEDYLNEIKSIMQKVFYHRNCIIISDNTELYSACLKRRIYKKAPFHHEKKESFADGLIVETLLHIDSIVKISADDEIIFVTGNISDFSSKDEQGKLHEDILNDLDSRGLKEKTKYVLRFCELVGRVLIDEVAQANLKEEFEQDLREQERVLLDAEIDDARRESVGLTPLTNFEDEFLENFRKSVFAQKIIEFLKRMNNCYLILEESYRFYLDDFSNFILRMNPAEIIEFIKKWNAVCREVNGCEAAENIGGTVEILDEIKIKASKYNFSDYVFRLPDFLEYGDNIIFYDKNKDILQLVMDPLYLSCDSGEMDQLDIKLLGNNTVAVAVGRIDITYGYVDFDDDGNIADACKENIFYNTDSIIKEISKIVDEFEQLATHEEQNIEKLKETFELKNKLILSTGQSY